MTALKRLQPATFMVTNIIRWCIPWLLKVLLIFVLYQGLVEPSLDPEPLLTFIPLEKVKCQDEEDGSWRQRE